MENNITVQRFINSIFNSNTYLLSIPENEKVWCVDPGDSEPVLQWIANNHKVLHGILLTHAHFDHIYGLNDLLQQFPQAVIYTSEYGAEGLLCDKLNGSRYMEFPFIVQHEFVKIVKEADKIEMWPNIFMETWETPGHNRDCLSFYVPDMVFTGDALIPGLKTVAKAKYSDKEAVLESIKKIIEQTSNHTMIFPGHGNECSVEKCKIVV